MGVAQREFCCCFVVVVDSQAIVNDVGFFFFFSLLLIRTSVCQLESCRLFESRYQKVLPKTTIAFQARRAVNQKNYS
jgi:hypothetical protein